jgi:hypothetical protein
MAIVEKTIYEIPAKIGSLVGTELFEGQEPADGVSFQVTLDNLKSFISGVAGGVVHDEAGNILIPAVESGSTYTNIGASGLITCTLPPAVNGLQYSIVRSSSSYEVRIAPASADTIGNSPAGEGKYLAMLAKNSQVNLYCYEANEWTVMSESGINEFEE